MMSSLSTLNKFLNDWLMFYKPHFGLQTLLWASANKNVKSELRDALQNSCVWIALYMRGRNKGT